MTQLLEISLQGGSVWQYDPAHVWEDDDYHEWADGEILRVSDEDFEGNQFWDNALFPVTAPQYRLAQAYGGYCKMGFGMIGLSQDKFSEANVWPPPRVFGLSWYRTAGSEADKEVFFEGSGYRAGFNKRRVDYDLYWPEYEQQLLAEVENYDGETVPLPRAVGTVQHLHPVRLADVAGKPTYHKAYIAGTVSIDWHAFDDGVDIDVNVIDHGDGTFSLSAVPVGEVTISGTAAETTLAELFSWGCNASNLSLSLDTSVAESPSPPVNYCASTQRPLIDFLSSVAEWNTHLFYIKLSNCYLVDMFEDNGSRTVTGSDFFEANYPMNPPVAQITARWTVRDAVEETIGKYIKDTQMEEVVASAYPYGNEKIELEPFDNDRTRISGSLTNILTLIHSPRAEIPLPIDEGLPVPGEAVTGTDDKTKQDVTFDIRGRNIRYDFGAKIPKAYIEGEGTLEA